MNNNIRYLKRHEIDIAKWDQCIASSPNGLIYANSWWLDIMAQHWSGLVLGDYEAVMPITWKKKYGIHYIYQPWFSSSLGLFAKTDSPCIDAFLDVIPRVFRYWDFDINEAYPSASIGSSLHIRSRTNLVIPQQNYDRLRSGYSRLAKRKIKKATGLVNITEHVDISTVIQFYQLHYQQAHPAIQDIDYANLLSATMIAGQKGHAVAYLATSGGNTLGCYLALQDQRYTYSLLGGTNAEGKEAGAFYLLTDHVIKRSLNENRSFRFEGSDIPGVAFFNRQFGPEPKPYQHIVRNRLPFPLKLLK